jgi:citrate synthase
MHKDNERLLNVSEAAARLGVKADTIYAYVSRGLLARRDPGDKESRFAAADIERLATRGRRGVAPKPQPLLITSELTDIADGAVYYRGKSAVELARNSSFEQVAEWLWGVPNAAHAAFVAPKAAVALARAVQSRMPEEALPLERLRVVAAVLGSADALRYETSHAPVVATARALIAGMVESLPRSGAKSVAATTLSARLWLRLTGMHASAARLHALDAALGLCADHALSPSTLAVRIAASQRADPYSLVQTGLGALGGALHGAAALSAEELLHEVERGGEPSQVIGARLRRGERIPGFGHRLHPDGDPRAAALLEILATVFANSQSASAALRVRAVMHARGLPAPNIDFALAALARAAHMLPGASEAIMAVARTAGWIAHALEEYARPSEFPWRALYVGLRPGDVPSNSPSTD